MTMEQLYKNQLKTVLSYFCYKMGDMRELYDMQNVITLQSKSGTYKQITLDMIQDRIDELKEE